MDVPQSPRDAGLVPLNLLTRKIIGCAIEVHRVLGPGLLESIYESAMCIEMDDAGLMYERQVSVPAYYKGHALGHYRIDLVVDGLVIIDIKSVERSTAVFEAQLLTYLRMMQKRVGLLINFNSALLKDGVTRLVL